MLRIGKDIDRYLVSTPSRLVGEFETQDILITHAFPNLFAIQQSAVQMMTQVAAGPHSRSYYVVSVGVHENGDDQTQTQSGISPHRITDLASLWFGKRFDFHGAWQSLGVFQIPYQLELPPTRTFYLGAYNHDARKDLEIQLNLDQISTPFKLVLLDEPRSKLEAFWRATSFYASALRAYDIDPEVAFFQLISALEIISLPLDFSEEELFDPELISYLEAVKSHVPDGEKVAQRFKSLLFQLSRRVRLAASRLTNDWFFSGSESEQADWALTKETLQEAVKNAYDVRSRYLHDGIRFASRLEAYNWLRSEITFAPPLNLTLLGLERLLRFMILRFAHLHITCLHDRLD